MRGQEGLKIHIKTQNSQKKHKKFTKKHKIHKKTQKIHKKTYTLLFSSHLKGDFTDIMTM